MREPISVLVRHSSKRTLVACRCFITMDLFGGITRFPFFIFCTFLFAFFCFSASFDVPWAMVVRSVGRRYLFRGSGCPLFSCLAPLRPWLRRVCWICLGVSLVSVRQRQRRSRRQRSRSPFRPPLAMSASTHRPSPRSTLPAFPLQRRSRSPPVVPPPSSSHLRRSLSPPKGVRLPPIQSLDFAPRPAPREPVPSQPLGTPLQDHYHQ